MQAAQGFPTVYKRIRKHVAYMALRTGIIRVAQQRALFTDWDENAREGEKGSRGALTLAFENLSEVSDKAEVLVTRYYLLPTTCYPRPTTYYLLITSSHLLPPTSY